MTNPDPRIIRHKQACADKLQAIVEKQIVVGREIQQLDYNATPELRRRMDSLISDYLEARVEYLAATEACDVPVYVNPIQLALYPLIPGESRTGESSTMGIPTSTEPASSSKLSAFELVELRMLQRGRGEFTDGRTWLRLIEGCVATIWLMFIADGLLPTTQGVDGLHSTLIMALGLCGAVATAVWIVRADSRTTAARLIELESKSNSRPHVKPQM
jgi:hypothetical protein